MVDCHRPRVPHLQHLERRQQRRPQPKARAAERDGDDGLERVGEAVEDHTPSSSWLSASRRQRESSSLLLAERLAERVARAAIGNQKNRDSSFHGKQLYLELCIPGHSTGGSRFKLRNN